MSLIMIPSPGVLHIMSVHVYTELMSNLSKKESEDVPRTADDDDESTVVAAANFCDNNIVILAKMLISMF